MAKKKQADTSIGPIFQVRDLTAGVNLRPTPTNVQPNQARRLLNAAIGNPGELGVYPGWETFSTTSLGARRCQGGKRIYLSGGNFTLAADNGSVYKPGDGGVWGAAVSAGWHATNQIDFVYDRDMVAVFDGNTIPKKSVDGTTWTQLGIDAPTVAPAASAIAGGSLLDGNTYEVAYAYYDSALNQISNISDVDTQAMAGANLRLRVGVTASADPQVTNIRLYVRDVTSGEEILRLQGTYANATANIDVDTNNWDAQEEAPTDHEVAVPMAFGCVWKNRWWGRDATVGNRLRFSQIFQPQSWPATFFVDIPFERGEDITMLIPLGDVLLVFGYTRFYLILGQTSLDFEVRPALGGQTGALGFRAGDVMENGVIHGGASGIYLFNGASDELLSYNIDSAWTSAVANMSSADLARLPIAYHKASKELRVAVQHLFPTSTKGEWVLDMNRTKAASGSQSDTGPAWFSTTRQVGGYIQWDGNEATTGNQGRIFSWGPTTAQLFEERTGTSADGGDITMEYDGYMLPFGLQSARVVETYLEYQPCEGTLTLDLKVDGRRMGTQSFDLGTNLPRYGTATYGTSTYAGGGDRAVLPVMWPLEAEGRTAQLLVKYVGQGAFKLYTYGHNAVPEDLPRGVRV
jgi:hypothetical protein